MAMCRAISFSSRSLRDIGTWSPLLVGQMRRLGVESIPIALFIAVFTGIVLALLSSYIFTGTVPNYFVGALVGKTIMLELGPVLTGMALAGRVGANIAAEIGTMKVTEQVDALETLAYDPGSYLVVPRVLRRELKPLQALAAEAAGIDAARLSARFATEGLPGELAPIAARLNELLARLEDSFERERRFSSDVAHEFRTPVAELRSLAELAIKLPDTRAASWSSGVRRRPTTCLI